MSSLLTNQYGVGGLFMGAQPKRKVFISYHHDSDQNYYDQFSQLFSGAFDLFYDNSLDRRIDSTNAEYVNRKIREGYIVGSSCTIVLCGSETYKRRWVDWEIHATLFHKHGLLGIALPNCAYDVSSRKYTVPARLHYNIQSGYAKWILWTQDISQLKSQIEYAVKNSNSNTSAIQNDAPKMKRSLS